MKCSFLHTVTLKIVMLYIYLSEVAQFVTSCHSFRTDDSYKSLTRNESLSKPKFYSYPSCEATPDTLFPHRDVRYVTVKTKFPRYSLWKSLTETQDELIFSGIQTSKTGSCVVWAPLFTLL